MKTKMYHANQNSEVSLAHWFNQSIELLALFITAIGILTVRTTPCSAQIGFDFGDAPDPTYPTLSTSQGAHHQIIRDFCLGTNVDTELDGLPNPDATGDDTTGIDDEDGVILVNPLVPGERATILVTARYPETTPLRGFLNAWIDFGADGRWTDPSDHICKGVVLNPGQNTIDFVVPADAAAGQFTFARFRFSTTENLSYTNQPMTIAPDGEVEDYMWKIESADYGDTPLPYATTRDQNGARHRIVQGYCLGRQIDGEPDGQPDELAKGDDTANMDDEDGVVFQTPLVIGREATVQVYLTTDGLRPATLAAWIDFDADGQWTTPDELVIPNQSLTPGQNTFTFQVPETARPGPTFARFRLTSQRSIPPTGYANDGEVEDYRVMILRPAPITNILITNISIKPRFYGWDEPSMIGDTRTIGADDWVCTNELPVTHIRWWGSFKNWRSTVPPWLPPSFRLTIWTDVPAGIGQSSHPGVKLWEVLCSEYTWKFAGWDLDPRTHTRDACFQFDCTLNTNQWFYQTNPPGQSSVFWLSIAATPPMPPIIHEWGWKTRPRNPAAPGAAVRFVYPNGPYQPIYWPYPTNLWDLAFELLSIRSQTLRKWEQPPDQSKEGLNVHATYLPVGQGPTYYLLADDFLCVTSGPISKIIIWGSWSNDIVPPHDLVSFTLSIHSDIPATPTNHSMPGKLLWSQYFGPGQYRYYSLEPTGDYEGWLTPPNLYIPLGDKMCFCYEFTVSTNRFYQTNGTIYWLAVQATVAGTNAFFGWKSTQWTNHWNDDAIWINAIAPYEGTGWKELRYPEGHPHQSQSLNLAFAIETEIQNTLVKWSQPPVSIFAVSLEWNAEPGVPYQLQAADYLTDGPCPWVNVGPEVLGPENELCDTNALAPHRFYRVIAPNVAP